LVLFPIFEIKNGDNEIEGLRGFSGNFIIGDNLTSSGLRTPFKTCYINNSELKNMKKGPKPRDFKLGGSILWMSKNKGTKTVMKHFL